MTKSAIALQREYYKQTANNYDGAHLAEFDEHFFALRMLVPLMAQFKCESLLDVGAGTGRTIQYLTSHAPNVRKVVGIEPSEDLRRIGHEKGIAQDQLIAGDGASLPYPDQSFDIVSCFGVLHHVKHAKVLVAEMLRVARVGVFISDANNFGQGSPAARAVKQTLNFMRLWPLFDYLRTGGKGYHQSEGDGIFYSFSVFNLMPELKKHCQPLHFFNTQNSGPNLYRTAPHVAVLGIKK